MNYIKYRWVSVLYKYLYNIYSTKYFKFQHNFRIKKYNVIKYFQKSFSNKYIGTYKYIMFLPSYLHMFTFKLNLNIKDKYLLYNIKG